MKTKDIQKLEESISFVSSESAKIEMTKKRSGGRGIPKCTLTAYTGDAVIVGGYWYPVVLDGNGISFASEKIPLRHEHMKWEGVGHGEKNSLDKDTGEVVIEGYVSRETEAAKEIVASYANGFPWQSSIGAKPIEYRFVDENENVTVNGREFTGPLYHVTESVIHEVSFVELGADSNSSVEIEASRKEKEMAIRNKDKKDGKDTAPVVEGTKPEDKAPGNGIDKKGDVVDPPNIEASKSGTPDDIQASRIEKGR